MHQHIFAFCAAPGCRDVPYHANTENLVSPAMSTAKVSEYFAYRSNDTLEGEAASSGETRDDYAVVPCQGDEPSDDSCPNRQEHWLYLRRDDPLMAAFRPQHFDPLDQGYEGNDTWSRAR